ncbi:MAG: CotH kinase family protein [Lachnospiraceae bacterium]|nr:CotH kinase family protein [Lachnospiraceae bacterium]
MFEKRKAALLLVVLSVLFLLVYVGVFKHPKTVIFLNIHNAEGEVQISLVEQRMDFSSSTKMRGEEYTIAKVNMQQGYADERNYLFLPDYMNLSEVYVVSSGAENCIVEFEGNPVEEKSATSYVFEENKDYNVTVNDRTVTFQIMKGSALPSVWIHTEGQMDYVHEDKANMVNGEISVLSGTGEPEYAGNMESFHGRGNSSWSAAKKSYTFKTEGLVSLLGMTPGRGWVLQGGALDATCMRNKIFMDMAVECGLENSVDSEWVDLYIDNEYYGCYLLTEKITVASGRLEIGDLEEQMEVLNDLPLDEYSQFNVPGEIAVKGYLVENDPADISGGYLLEVETYIHRYNLESSGFITREGIPILVKGPEHASYNQVLYISSYVQEFEEALYAPDGYNSNEKYYLDYIDLESFALRYLIEEISKNIDAGFSSYFFYKPEGEDKMYAGPVWDFDTGIGNSLWGDQEMLRDPKDLYVNRAIWSEQLWAKPDFQEAVKELYAEELMPYLDELIENGLDEYENTIYESVQMEAVLMGRENVDEDFRFIKEFLQGRRDWLEEELIGE